MTVLVLCISLWLFDVLTFGQALAMFLLIAFVQFIFGGDKE